MTHYLSGFIPDIECPTCNGTGEVCGVNPNRRSRFVGMDDLSPDDFTIECSACAGHGWRPMDEDELEIAAEKQAEDRSSEPRASLDEQYAAAWAQKQALRSGPHSPAGPLTPAQASDASPASNNPASSIEASAAGQPITGAE